MHLFFMGAFGYMLIFFKKYSIMQYSSFMNDAAENQQGYSQFENQFQKSDRFITKILVV